MARIRRFPFAFYLLLAFGLCWLFWIPRALLSHDPRTPEALLVTLHLLGAFGPAAAAVLTVRITGGRGAVRALFAPYLRWCWRSVQRSGRRRWQPIW